MEDQDNNGPTEEDLIKAKSIAEEVNKYLGVMINSVQEFDVKNFFVANAAVCRQFTPEDIAKDGKVIPPWEIPEPTVQMHMLHFKIEMILAMLVKSGVVDIAIRNALAAKENSTLIKPVGPPPGKLII